MNSHGTHATPLTVDPSHCTYQSRGNVTGTTASEIDACEHSKEVQDLDWEHLIRLSAPHRDAMARVAAALVGAADAEDAVQEVLMRARDTRHAWPVPLDDEAAMRRQLLKLTYRRCKLWLRGRFGTRRRGNVSLPDPESEDRREAALAADPYLQTLGSGTPEHAEALDLFAAIASLDDQRREVILLKYFCGLNSSEIGNMLGLSASRVRQLTGSALACLEQRLKEPRFGEGS